eukprot:4487340-Ditylum_brightwellii.AAC.1
MSFGLDKCAILLIKNGKYTTPNICPEIPKLDDDENKGYRYLGIMEGVDFHCNEVKEMTEKEYMLRVQKILNANMNGDYTMTTICVYATPVLHYTFGIMKWTKGELRKLDIKTQKLLTMKGIHHPKCSVHHLYLHWIKGFHGLTGVEDTHNCECAALSAYVCTSTDAITEIMRNTPTSTQKFLFKFAAAPNFTNPEMMGDNRRRCLIVKPLHGKSFKQQEEIPQVDLDKLHQWLRRAHLCPKMEAAICTAQEQTMAKNYIRKKIFRMNVNPICRMCCKENKTILYIVSGCELLAGTKYTELRNKICQYLHWYIMQDNNIPVNPNWQKHKPKLATLVTNQLLITYDMTQGVENVVEANCPDIVLLDKKEKRALIIDVTIPVDINMIKAAA